MTSTGRGIFYAVMTASLAISGFLFIASTIDSREPVIWGTYTQTDCEPKVRGGCRSFGTFVSDDRSLTKEHIALDGSVDADGNVRAGYRPTGVRNDEDNNIVHAGPLTFAGPWVSLLLVVVIAGILVRYAFVWGHLNALWQLRQRRSLSRKDEGSGS